MLRSFVLEKLILFLVTVITVGIFWEGFGVWIWVGTYLPYLEPWHSEGRWPSTVVIT